MALVMLGILPPLLGATWYASYRADKIFRADAQQTMNIKADALGERINQWHEQNLKVLDELRAGSDFSTMERDEQLPTMLSTLQARKADVDRVATVDLNGEVVADVSARPRLHTNYRNQDWFQTTISGDSRHAQTTLLLPQQGEPTVLFSKPILSQPALVMGDRNGTVAQLQSRLKNLDYYAGPIDGIYERGTVEAIRQFKQAFNQANTAGESLGEWVDAITWQTIELAEQAKTEKVAPIAAEMTRTASRLDILHPDTAKVEGVVMMEAQLNEITQAVSQVSVSQDGYALVLDEKGQVLAHSNQLPEALKAPDTSPVTSPAANPVASLETSHKSAQTPFVNKHLAMNSQVQRKTHQRFHQAVVPLDEPSVTSVNEPPATKQGDPTDGSSQQRQHLSAGDRTASAPKTPAAVASALPLNPASKALSNQLTRINTPNRANPIALASSPPVRLATLPNLSHFPPVAALLQGKSGPLSFHNQGERWIAHGESLANGWSVLLLQPNADFAEDARLFRNLSVTTAAIALLVAAGVMGILSARLAQPIHRLSAAATAISHGQLDQKIDIDSPDEIGTLATAFNSVADQLQLSFSQLADQNESLKRLDQLKDQFLANTSHELKTPLNGMIGIAESLLDGAAGNLTDLQKQNIAMIASSSHRLTRLVNDILDFSKLQHQHLVLQRKALGIRASVDVVLALSRSLMGNQSLQLINNIPVDLPLVYADENRLQQILLNLVSNAIKFTEKGTITVSAELVAAESTESTSNVPTSNVPTHLAIAIRDTGIGISNDRLAHIFEPFQQVENSAKSYGGTGLGLSITRNLVTLHQGKIWVESVLAEGSTFTFTLPLVESLVESLGEKKEDAKSSTEKTNYFPQHSQQKGAKPAAKPELTQLRSLRQRAKLSTTLAKVFQAKNVLETTATATLEARQLNPNKFNILVVDDEPINVQVLKNHLSLENYTVTQALNGAEALALINEGQKNNKMFDLVVLDVMMPRMSGYEVCAKLREIHPAHELPVVMLTAKSQVSDLITGFQFGANDYMTKPFSKDELLTRIQSHLRLSKTSHSYGRFVPNEYLRFLEKESIVDVQLGDHVSKEMAVMFSDIRSFTTLSESMTPQENFDFVNAYLRQVSPVIRNQGGFIVKYLGDGMMAVFPQGTDDAVAAGVAKLRSVTEYNQRRQEKGFAPIAVGIGIHFGHMMVGMVGESARMQGDAFSDNVNLTARLESLTKLYGVSLVISDRALTLLSHPEKYQTRFLDRVIVKGRSEPIDLYHILDGEPDSMVEQLEHTQAAFSTGIFHYQAGDFLCAKDCFEQVLQQYPENKAAQVYCDRLDSLIQTPPTNWNGVWRLTQK